MIIIQDVKKLFWASILASLGPLVVGVGVGAYFFVTFRPFFGEVIIVGLLMMFPLLVYRYRRSAVRARRLAKKAKRKKEKLKKKARKRK